jgi:hypothetical protein
MPQPSKELTRPFRSVFKSMSYKVAAGVSTSIFGEFKVPRRLFPCIFNSLSWCPGFSPSTKVKITGV